MLVAPAAGAAPGAPRRRVVDIRAAALGGLAAAVVLAGVGLGWRGVDLPAQLYRVGLFRREGFALWDSQWYGGHWLLDYSVIFPAVAASVGVATVVVLSAVVATVSFDRLVSRHLGAQARGASLVFAAGVAVQSSIGQLTFLLGEAAGLWCLVAVGRRRFGRAVALALAATLASPLAGAFVALAVVALWLAHPGRIALPQRTALPGRTALPQRTARPGPVLGPVAVLAAVAVPLGATSVLFPGQGPMPYPFVDYLWELLVAGGVWALAAGHRTLRVGAVLFALAASASEVVATPLGGNIGRLEDLVALPLCVALLWPRDHAQVRATVGPEGRQRLGPEGRRRLGPEGRWRLGPADLRRLTARRRRWLLAAVAVPLALSQWAPAWGAITVEPGRPWTHAAYYRPLVSYLAHRPAPEGRTEVVPTADHWESEYVAPTVPLARGWERQLDVADNPIFYRPGALGAASYLAWLVDSGVRWVALASAPLDSAGQAEGALIARGVPGLRRVWHNVEWGVYEVEGSDGLVGGGARLVSIDGSRVVVAVTRQGSVTVRVRWSTGWRVTAGAGTVSEAPGRWVLLTAPRPEVVQLHIALF